MRSTGTVRMWDHDEGWGFIDSEDTPGGARATWRVVVGEAVMPENGDLSALGFRPGTSVHFRWEESGFAGDDRYAVTSVWPTGIEPPRHLPGRTPFFTCVWEFGAPDADGFRTGHQITEFPPTPPRLPRSPRHRTSGSVRDWNDEFGWGVLDSPDTPGGAWAHYSELSGTGFRSVTPGDAVEFEWEAAEQDGFDYRAYRVETLPRGGAGQ